MNLATRRRSVARREVAPAISAALLIGAHLRLQSRRATASLKEPSEKGIWQRVDRY